MSTGTATGALIEARDVHVRLGGSLILRGVDLRVRPGEVVGLLGTNGSGKSTLVRALVGVVPLVGGTVELMGAPLGPRVPWQRIGYVPQRVSASSGLPSTAAEVVASGTIYGRRLRRPRGWRDQVAAALDQVDLADHAGEAIADLSGGQQQRVLIARALVRRPDLLIMDEPVAGVDLPSQAQFARTLTSLVAGGMTVLVVVHELGELSELIERAVVIRHGQVVHDGAPPVPHAPHAGTAHHHQHPHADQSEGTSTVGLHGAVPAPLSAEPWEGP